MNLHLEIEFVGLFFLLICFPIYWKSYNQISHEKLLLSNRNTIIDFIRGLAMIGIVCIHIDSYFAFYHPNDSFLLFTKLISNLSRFSVPVFILSSALFLKWKTNKQYWSTKIQTLLIPFVVCSILGYFTKYNILEEGFLNFLFRIFLGKVFEPYYYIPLLFQFYLLYAIFYRHTENISSSKKLIYIFLAGIINFISNQYFPKNTYFIQTIENISFTNFVFFFTVGFYSKEIFLNTNTFLNFWNSRIGNIFLITTTIFVLYICYITFQTPFLFSNHYLFYPFTMFVILFFLGLKWESGLTYKTLYNLLSYIGKHSLAIFLLHPLTIHLMHLFDPYVLFGPYLSYFITLILNLGLPLLAWHSATRVLDLLKKAKET